MKDLNQSLTDAGNSLEREMFDWSLFNMLPRIDPLFRLSSGTLDGLNNEIGTPPNPTYPYLWQGIERQE